MAPVITLLQRMHRGVNLMAHAEQSHCEPYRGPNAWGRRQGVMISALQAQREGQKSCRRYRIPQRSVSLISALSGLPQGSIFALVVTCRDAAIGSEWMPSRPDPGSEEDFGMLICKAGCARIGGAGRGHLDRGSSVVRRGKASSRCSGLWRF
jgi:hypothetical protein